MIYLDFYTSMCITIICHWLGLQQRKGPMEFGKLREKSVKIGEDENLLKKFGCLPETSDAFRKLSAL